MVGLRFIMKNTYIQKQREGTKQQGFAMLFTVLVISIILAIAIGVSSASYKQGILSGLVADSQIAFYQADSASECALAARNSIGTADENGVEYVPHCLGLDTDGNPVAKTFTQTNIADSAIANYRVYEQDSVLSAGTAPCFVMAFDDTFIESTQRSITGYGYNICATGNPRRLERAVQLYY